MNDQVERTSLQTIKIKKMRSSDSEFDTTDELSEVIKPKKKVKFKIQDEGDDIQHKKRKVLEYADVDNTEDIPTETKKKAKKQKTAEHQREDHNGIEEEGHEHVDESHSNDNIDWPQSDLRTLVKNIEQALPEKDNLAFQTRADKLNWDDIAFEKYTGDDCKKTWFLIQKRIRRFRLLSELLQDAKEWISKPWTHFYRGNKHNRHPDMPKRPLSGYMLYYIKKKDKVLAQHPGLEMTEISKRMAQMYKNISQEKRDKYTQLALAERKAYEEKIEAFYRLHPEIPRFPEKANHSKAVEAGPKKPSTPFSYYYNNVLKNFPLESEADRASFKEQCKEQWKNLADKKKIVWIDIALEEEDKYQETLKDYLVQNPNYISTFKSFVSKEERAMKERLAGKPVKPPNSAYSLFSQIMLKSKEIKKIDPKGRMKALADQWKICSDPEKKIYQEHVDQLMNQYKLDFAAYLESLPESKRQEELQNNLPKRKIKKVDESKNKNEEDKNKNDIDKGKNDEEKNNIENHREEIEKVGKVDKEKEKEKEREKPVEKPKVIEKPKAEEAHSSKEPVASTSKKKKKKKGSSNGKKGESKKGKKKVSLSKMFRTQPAHPPESGFALFSKRYHGRTPVKSAWKHLNKQEKREYEAEVQMLKQKYIRDYELFLKSLSKEQLTAFSLMNTQGKAIPIEPEPEVKKELSSEEEEDDEFDEDYTEKSYI